MLRSVASCAFVGLLALGFPLAKSAPSSAPVPAPLTQKVDYNKFRIDFDLAVKLGSKTKQDNLVTAMETEAIHTLVETADAISNAPNDILYDRFNALRASWNRLKQNDFPDQLELYFVNLLPADKRLRRKTRSRYDVLTREGVKLLAANETAALLPLSMKFEKVADEFQQFGDQWYESQARFAAATYADEQYFKKKTDFDRVTKLYERAVLLREELGVKDVYYRTMLPRMKSLVGLGFGSGSKANDSDESGPQPRAADPKKDDGGKGEPESPSAAGSILTASLEFVQLKDIKDDLRPNYYLDEHYQMWPTLSLSTVGDKKSIPRLGDASPTVMRLGAVKVGVDTDKDGESDVEWPTRGKLDNVTFDLGEGALKRTWSLLVEMGRTQDFYQGNQINLEPTKQNFNLYYVPGGYMEGKLGGVEIEVYDDNLDGIYGSMPTLWAYSELRPGTNQPEVDSLRIGGEKKARPMSEYVNLDREGWHSLKIQNGGTEVTAEPVSFKTGTLQLKTKGIKPDFVIMKGAGTALGNTYIDISGGKKVEVPVGRWDLFYGILREGKKMQAMKAVILSTDATPGYSVKEGENVIVKLGAPFGFSFDYSLQQDTATLKGLSVQVTGAGGEAYDRFYGYVPRPEASIRKKGSKRGYASEKTRPAESQQDIETYGWNACWKPLDVIFDSKGDEVEIKLYEKKNKLFGTIESDWL